MGYMPFHQYIPIFGVLVVQEAISVKEEAGCNQQDSSEATSHGHTKPSTLPPLSLR